MKTVIHLLAASMLVLLTGSLTWAQGTGEAAANLQAAKEISAASGRPIFAVAGSST